MTIWNFDGSPNDLWYFRLKGLVFTFLCLLFCLLGISTLQSRKHSDNAIKPKLNKRGKDEGQSYIHNMETSII